jgi:hypothetical protein
MRKAHYAHAGCERENFRSEFVNIIDVDQGEPGEMMAQLPLQKMVQLAAHETIVPSEGASTGCDDS